MIKRICDKCGNEIKSKNIPVIEFSKWELAEDGSKDCGSTSEEFEVCLKCYNKYLREFK